MTAGWTGSDLEAGDVAWRAWRELGVEAYDLVFDRGDTPALLVGLEEAMAPQLDRITRAVLDEAEVRLYGEARERVVRASQHEALRHVLWSVVGAVRHELMRPDPVPFAPPAAGAWVRGRWDARPARWRRRAPRDAEWDGKWHAFAGDLNTGPGDLWVMARARCGVRVRLRGPHGDDLGAIAEERPGVDVCGHCSRIVAGRPPNG